MNRLTLLFPLLLAAGCQGLLHPMPETARDYLPPRGARLVLHQALVIPPNHASTFLQFGQALRHADVNIWHPHCRLEVREVHAQPQTVQPDEFEIMRAGHEYRSTVRAGDRTLLAGAGGSWLARRDDGGPGAQAYVTRMILHSPRQPQVLDLACGHWSQPPEDRHLSLSEIRGALGPVMTLAVGGGAGTK